MRTLHCKFYPKCHLRVFTFQKSLWGVPSDPCNFSTYFTYRLRSTQWYLLSISYTCHVNFGNSWQFYKCQEIHLTIRINISSTVYIYYHISCRNTTLIIFTCTPPTTMLPAVMSLNHYHLEVMWSFSLTCLSSTTNIKLYSSPLSSYWAT